MHCKRMPPDGHSPMTTHRSKEVKTLTKVDHGSSTSSINENMKKCPLTKCTYQVLTKKDMLRHVKSSHRPLKSDPVFWGKIDQLFIESE